MKNKNKQQNNVQSIFVIMLIVMALGIAESLFDHKAKAVGPTPLESPVVAVATITELEKIEVIPVKLLTNKPEVEFQIRAIADELNFQWPDYLVRLAMAESSMNPKAISKPNKNGSVDYGLFQWNDKMPPLPITKECSLDLDCSTRMTIKAINLGMQHHWMTNELAKSKK